MTGWTVMLRGIRFRAGRSALVLLLAAVATAAAVTAAGYQRAAEQSVLTDGLRSAPAYQTAVIVAASGTDGAGAPSIDDAHLAVNRALGTHPALAAHFGRSIAAEDTDTLITARGGQAMSEFSYREGVCAHLVIVGQCAAAPGEVMVSKRSASTLGIKVGDRIPVRFGVTAAAGAPTTGANSGNTLSARVVGLYTPANATDPYWGSNAYFANGIDPTAATPRRLDAIFTPSEQDVRTDPAAQVSVHLEIPLLTGSVGVDQVAGLRSDLAEFVLGAKAAGLTVATGLTDVLDGAATAQHSLQRTVPIVAVPLVLLCLFVLFLVVAALADERGPEIALAKLRGFAPGRAARFGVAEVITLIVLATPIGIVLGIALTELGASTVLAHGTRVEVRWPLFVAGILSMLAGSGAAWLAARRTLRQSVLGLMRRVPERTGWRAGLGEGVAVALVAASLVAAVLNRSSPIAWLAAPSIALVAGLIAARLLAVGSRWRLRSAAKHGRIVGLLAGARLARQPGRHRVVAVVTVAIALLVFAATAWDVGAGARSDNADDSLGAARVYSVIAPYPSALVSAVDAADPSGNTMAVVRSRQYFKNGDVELVGVESSLLPQVALWRGESPATLASISTALRPAIAPELVVHGTITVTASVQSATPGAVDLGALVSASGQPPHSISLGTLEPDKLTYTGTLTGCAAGCRLLGLTVGRSAPGAGHADATISVSAIQAGGASVTTFANASRWRVDGDRAPDAHVRLTPGAALGITVSSTDPNAALIAYEDAPAVLPAVVAGGSPDGNPGASTFSFPGLGSDPEPMSVAARAPRLPRVGTDGLLFDLGDAVAVAERSGTLADSTTLQYEVWANASAPADLPTRLSAHGISVLRTETVSGYLGQLSRGAPTLSLWFYLFAGALALLLAVGVVLLGAFVGSEARVYEYAALKVAGVQPRLLRRALLREYRSTLGVAMVIGLAAGIGGAVLMLPGIPLVSVGGPVGDVPYGARMVALPFAIVISVLAMATVVLLALRLLRRATPERLREGTR